MASRLWQRCGETLALGLVMVSVVAAADRPRPVVESRIEGDPVVKLLDYESIPAIRQPSFVSAAEADEFMEPDEPVLGVVIGDEARAYSLWALDTHEIVHDRVGETPIAATW